MILFQLFGELPLSLAGAKNSICNEIGPKSLDDNDDEISQRGEARTGGDGSRYN